MPICSNPKERRIRIPVGDAAVILVFREYTQQEFQEFMESRFSIGRRGKMKDNGMAARVKFADRLLVDILAEDASGNPDYVTYIDPGSGEERTLDPEVEGWQNYVNPSWKQAAVLELETVDARLEDQAVKN